jgi:hypothetical protein
VGVASGILHSPLRRRQFLFPIRQKILPLHVVRNRRSHLKCKFIDYHSDCCGLVSVVGIETGYGLDGPGIEFRWGRDFSTPVWTDPGAHPASCTMGTKFFLEVKSGRDVTLTPLPLLIPQSFKGTPPMGRTARTEPQCLYKGALYLDFTAIVSF